ncbi:putative monocarboxylate transporter [Penicillium brasilianum]|uniref:Putative monocarboxylate transporter n=1 Tax=Penicillium brasilianum TaxID=104259 RepID=A0A1S9RMR9_PENBI|nr:putative monocarboxylate transporter [Penicillium brasilianum]
MHEKPQHDVQSTEDQISNVIESSSQLTNPPNDSSPPDGGYGWVCTVAAATINAHSWGFNSAYAVFLAHYLNNNIFPGATALQYALVGSLSLTCLMLISPVATLAVGKIGIRATMFCGVVLETASLLCASWASQIWHLFLTQGLVFGVGLGLIFIPVAAVVPQWFTTKRSLASGVSLAGAGLGGAVYSLAASAMIRNLGLRLTYRILGSIAFVVNTSCTLLIKDRNRATGSKRVAFDARLFRRWEYNLLLGFSVFSMLGYFILIFSLANFANSIGLNASQASVASALFNIGQAIGRPLIGYFSDTTGRINMAGSMTLLAGVLPLVIWTNTKSYGVLIFFAIVEGLVAGNFWATIAPLVAEIVGLENVPCGLNLLWLVIAIPCTFSEPVALEIFSGTGSYLGTQLFTGFMYIAAATCMLALRGWKITQKTQSVDESDFSSDGSSRCTEETEKTGARDCCSICLTWANV